MEKFKHERFLSAVNYIVNNKIVKNKSGMASIFHISPSKFSEILKERMNPGFELYQILVNNFNISSEWLITGKGEMIKAEKPKMNKTLYNESITKSITESITNEKCKKSYTSISAEQKLSGDSQSEIIQLLKENKKLVEEKNAMLEKENKRLNNEVGKLSNQNKALVAKNANLQAKNKELAIQLNYTKQENNALKKGLQNRAAG